MQIKKEKNSNNNEILTQVRVACYKHSYVCMYVGKPFTFRSCGMCLLCMCYCRCYIRFRKYPLLFNYEQDADNAHAFCLPEPHTHTHACIARAVYGLKQSWLVVTTLSGSLISCLLRYPLGKLYPFVLGQNVGALSSHMPSVNVWPPALVTAAHCLLHESSVGVSPTLLWRYESMSALRLSLFQSVFVFALILM